MNLGPETQVTFSPGATGSTQTFTLVLKLNSNAPHGTTIVNLVRPQFHDPEPP